MTKHSCFDLCMNKSFGEDVANQGSKRNDILLTMFSWANRQDKH